MTIKRAISSRVYWNLFTEFAVVMCLSKKRLELKFLYSAYEIRRYDKSALSIIPYI